MIIQLIKMNTMMLPSDAVSLANFAALDEGVYTATLKPVTAKATLELRREAQRKLYFDCVGALVKAGIEPGWKKADWHLQLKRLYLLPIVIRTQPVIARMVKSLDAVALNCGDATTEDIQKGIIEMLSTRNATHSQFSDYVSQVIHYCRQQAVPLKIDAALLALAEAEGHG